MYHHLVGEWRVRRSERRELAMDVDLCPKERAVYLGDDEDNRQEGKQLVGGCRVGVQSEDGRSKQERREQPSRRRKAPLPEAGRARGAPIQSVDCSFEPGRGVLRGTRRLMELVRGGGHDRPGVQVGRSTFFMISSTTCRPVVPLNDACGSSTRRCAMTSTAIS